MCIELGSELTADSVTEGPGEPSSLTVQLGSHPSLSSVWI